jgi:two-component system OmpR family response regulator
MNDPRSIPIPKIFVVCDRNDTAPLWGYVLRKQGLTVFLETRVERALESWSAEMPELVVIDVDKQDSLALCRGLRSISLAPILLFLPEYDKPRILEAYAAGADDVLVRPIRHTFFIPRILLWLRRSWSMPVDGLNLLAAGKYQLVPGLRSVITPDDVRINLTNLEFRLLYFLMSRPGQVVLAEELVESIWGRAGRDDHTLKNVVCRLRKKIEPDSHSPVVIKTLHGGYCFQG